MGTAGRLLTRCCRALLWTQASAHRGWHCYHTCTGGARSPGAKLLRGRRRRLARPRTLLAGDQRQALARLQRRRLPGCCSLVYHTRGGARHAHRSRERGRLLGTGQRLWWCWREKLRRRHRWVRHISRLRSRSSWSAILGRRGCCCSRVARRRRLQTPHTLHPTRRTAVCGGLGACCGSSMRRCAHRAQTCRLERGRQRLR